MSGFRKHKLRPFGSAIQMQLLASLWPLLSRGCAIQIRGTVHTSCPQYHNTWRARLYGPGTKPLWVNPVVGFWACCLLTALPLLWDRYILRSSQGTNHQRPCLQPLRIYVDIPKGLAKQLLFCSPYSLDLGGREPYTTIVELQLRALGCKRSVHQPLNTLTII